MKDSNLVLEYTGVFLPVNFALHAGEIHRVVNHVRVARRDRVSDGVVEKFA